MWGAKGWKESRLSDYYTISKAEGPPRETKGKKKGGGK